MIIKISGIVICCILLCLIIKNIYPSYVFTISLILSVFISIYAFRELLMFFDVFNSELTLINNSYFKIILKVIGISYVAEFTTNICKEHGFITAAYAMELITRITLVLFCMPVIKTLLELVNRCIK